VLTSVELDTYCIVIARSILKLQTLRNWR